MAQGVDRDRLSVASAGLLLGLALSRLVQLPAQSYEISLFGSPLGLTLSGTTLALAILAGLGASATELLLRACWLPPQLAARRTIIHWILPALLALALGAWLSQIEDLGLWTLILVAGGPLIPLLLIAEYNAFVQPWLQPDDQSASWWKWVRLVLAHLVALILFTVVYDAGLRNVLSGPGVFLAAMLLALRLFWPEVQQLRAALLYSIVPGLALAEMAWVLNYGQLSTLRAGLLLLLLFYLVVGLLLQFLAGQLQRRVVLEYSAVAVLALLLLTFAVP